MSTTNPEFERGLAVVALKKEIDTFSARDLANIDDKKLSELYSSTVALGAVAQQKRIEHEWQRRLVVEQSKATMKAAWIGVVGVVVGFLLSSAWQTYKDYRSTSQPNQALEPTPMSVTPPAAQEPRRP